MREAINYDALSWVYKELGDTLRQARVALEAYADGDARQEVLQNCVSRLHEARGPLRMANLREADLLASEMEEALADLLLGSVAEAETALELLMRGFLELPEYLATLRTGRRVNPEFIFPLINSLRAVRGIEPLRQEQVFSPDLSRRVPETVFNVRDFHDDHDMAARVRAARVRFQGGLLKWYRGESEKRALAELQDVLGDLQQMACSEPVARLWWAGGGLAELLSSGELDETPEIKRLFGQLDRSVKRLLDSGEAVFTDFITDDLLKNILFQISRSVSKNERIQKIRETYGLKSAVSDAAPSASGDLSDDLLRAVSSAAQEDIERIKQAIDTAATVPGDYSGLAVIADELHALANLLGMIGLEESEFRVAVHTQQLRAVRADEDPGEILSDLASCLVAVEDALADLVSGDGEVAETRGASTYREGCKSVLAAVMADMAEVREALDDYLTRGESAERLQVVSELLKTMSGGLRLAGEQRLSMVLSRLCEYTSSGLPDADGFDPMTANALSDVICSVEFCVEQLVAGARYSDQSLEIAENSLAALGYPLATGMQHVASVAPVSITPPAVELQPVSEPYAALPETGNDEDAAAGDEPGPVSVYPVIAAEADPEITEIFIEEAGEVLESLQALIPSWCAEPQDSESLAAIRRAFHTLKGSGRMAGAMAIGEFSWVLENLLNRVIDRSVTDMPSVTGLLTSALPLLKDMVEEVASEHPCVDKAVDVIASAAQALANGTGSVVAATVADAAEAQPGQETGFVEAGTATTTDYPVLAEESDPEIVEIFLEEARDELVSLRVSISHWIADPQDQESLATARRGFHTLKGSGRMAGAMQIGELAWSMEVMLNAVLEGSLEPGSAMFVVLSKVPAVLEEMLQQLETGSPVSSDVNELVSHAIAIAEGGNPALPQEQDPVNDAPDAVADDEPSLLELFAAECTDHLAVLTAYVADAEDGGMVTEPLFRTLHTLSGNCESAEVPGIGALAEPLYEYFSNLYENSLHVVPAAYAVLDDCIHEMRQQLERLPSLSFDEWVVAQLQGRIHSLAARQVSESEAADVAAADASDVLDDPQAFMQADDAADEVSVTEFTLDIPANPDTAVDGTMPVGMDIPSVLEASIEFEQDSSDPEVTGHSAQAVDADDVYAEMDPELYEIFVEESTEIMEAGEQLLRRWSADAENTGLLEEFQRMLHTLKGGARMVDIKPVGDVSHAVESLLGKVTDGVIPATEPLFVLLNDAFDLLADMVDRVRARQPAGDGVDMEWRLLDFMSREAAPRTEVDEPATVAQAEIDVQEDAVPHALHAATADKAGDECVADAGDAVHASAGADMLAQSGVVQIAASTEFPAFSEIASRTAEYHAKSVSRGNTPSSRGELIRVHADVLDRLVNNSGEISIYRARMEQQVSSYRFSLGELEQTISRLRDQLRKLEMETEAQILYRYEQESENRSEGFDPLELDRYSNLQQLSRSLIESISDLRSLQEIMEHTTRDAETLLLQQSRVSTDLQEILIRSRMIAFEGLAPRLRRVVRQTARDMGRKVELELYGADGEMDRAVADRVVAPLEHMLRNAIAHGIEPADKRRSAGKPPVGTIRIDFDREGPEIVLRISDDGAGMNIPAIRKQAVERGLISEDAQLADAEIMQFVLQTGFSTASEVTQISGRGVGMDVVSNEVKQLGGSLHIDSESGKGAVFTVRLPYTLAINQALLVSAAEQAFCVPLSSIEGVVRLYPDELMACYQSDNQEFEYAGNRYQLRHLATVLGIGGLAAATSRQQIPVLLMKIGERRLGIQVDALMGNREVVIKPLGTQLASIEGISGATILGDGSVVMILDMVAVSRMNTRVQPVMQPVAAEQDDRLSVMVVDDSITVRKVTSRLLERNGYRVLTAKDGIDAIGQLQETVPDMMLLDIEMPRMDGFELATHIRNDDRLRHIPIIMITSRTGDKHRDRARAIGVNHYLGKPYQESDLLESIQQIIGANPVAALA